MPIRLRLLAAAVPLGLILPGTAHALPSGGTCLEGTCEDGIGTFLDTATGTTYRGLFSNGLFAPSSTYEVVHPNRPGQVYRAATDAGRNWILTETWRTETQFFSGSTKVYINPFTQHQVASYDKGRFEDGPDIVYEGQFDYVTLPPTDAQRQAYDGTAQSVQVGIYMFSGTRSSKSKGTTEYGIFATDTAYPFKPLVFHPADPARIAEIRAGYAAALNAENARTRQAAAAAQQSAAEDADLLGTLFQVAAGGLLASSMGQMGGGLGGGLGGVNAMNLTQVVGVMTGVATPDQALATMTQQYMAQGLGAAVGATSPQDFAAIAAGLAAGGTVPTTQGALTAAMLAQAQAQMQAQQAAAATTAPVQPLAVSTGTRVPKLDQITLPCTNTHGSFSGTFKVPKSAADCRKEVIAHRKVQCRSDWATDPSYAAMTACFQQKGIADLTKW